MGRSIRQKQKPPVCFAPEGESHSGCQNEPFSDDANFPSHEQRSIWIGYRNDLDRSYNGGMTFRQILAQAETNLSRAMKLENATDRTRMCEAFPGIAIQERNADDDILRQLQQGTRAFNKANCASATCKLGAEPELLQMEWISIKSTGTEAFVSVPINISDMDTDLSKQLVAYVFQLQGHEMITICLRYLKGLYRFQRTDGSVSPDMFLRLTPIDEPTEVEADNEGAEVAPVQTLISTLSTTNEYTGMISQICHTYGIRVLEMPNLTTHINALKQAVREDNRLALCRSFAKIKTILIVNSTSTASEFLAEEYETMVSSTVAEFGVDLLNSTEGVMFMEMMGEAMEAGQREYLCTAYANLRAYMVAYAGHTVHARLS
ncbi:hypothetical protein E4T52_16754 [Aureobasidium sp. EXF-3400]|nr:hypothetical protein E4T51_16035 [Aureobasidium sp. EXF-12344]KAI4768144.1 hypothetical protein E4T52_16754 [Aureobasidium sp. EXF-3400]